MSLREGSDNIRLFGIFSWHCHKLLKELCFSVQKVELSNANYGVKKVATGTRELCFVEKRKKH